MTDSALKIRLKQRWLFKDDNTTYIAEVVQHANGSESATVKVRQVIKGGSGYIRTGQYLYNIYLLTDNRWSYMTGQDRPGTGK